MRTFASQMNEAAECHQDDAAEEKARPQQPGYSRFGIQDSLIPLRRQRVHLVEKPLTDRVRLDVGLFNAQHPVHLVERISRAFDATTGTYCFFPLGACDRRRVIPEQL